MNASRAIRTARNVVVRSTRSDATRSLGSLPNRSNSAHRGIAPQPSPNRDWSPPAGAQSAASGVCVSVSVSAPRRSMVTVTQTKTSEAPLYSAPRTGDDGASSSEAPTYVRNEDTTLNVTQGCLDQVERLLRQRRESEGDNSSDGNDGYFLRTYVDAGGCSGFQYQFEVDNDLDEDEDVVVVFALDGGVPRPRVVVDETSMGFLEGSTIDYVVEMIKSAFVVTDNPQSESACGCGSSFAMKNFEKFGTGD